MQVSDDWQWLRARDATVLEVLHGLVHIANKCTRKEHCMWKGEHMKVIINYKAHMYTHTHTHTRTHTHTHTHTDSHAHARTHARTHTQKPFERQLP